MGNLEGDEGAEWIGAVCVVNAGDCVKMGFLGGDFFAVRMDAGAMVDTVLFACEGLFDGDVKGDEFAGVTLWLRRF